jgi:aryl-alcohol dehydrogenase-like predicted oxidoreductase
VIATKVGKAMGDGEAGKVRAIGASNFTAARLSEALAVSAAHGLPRYECLQPHCNLVERPPYEAELEAVCVEHGLDVPAALDAVAARLNSTPTQVALAWQIARPSISAPIASATSLDQLKDLLAAASLKLDADAIRSIDRASAGR